MLISWEQLFSSCNVPTCSGVELLKISQGSISSYPVLFAGDDVQLRKEKSGLVGLRVVRGRGGKGLLSVLKSLFGVDSDMVAR